MQRYEVFRRANLNKGGVKKVITSDFGYRELTVLAFKPDPITVHSTEYRNCNRGIYKGVYWGDCGDGEGIANAPRR